ncbi:MAG: hypothetical protein HY763_13405 [Planctomycetes bacterium]|nr:hypothetical protein [Planctomycetota bacterium]
MPKVVRSGLCTAVWGLLVAPQSASAGPLPVGNCTTTVAYITDAGPVSFSGDRDFSGIGPQSSQPLGAAPNVTTLNAVNLLGFRPRVDTVFPEAIGDGESLLYHGIYKKPDAYNGEFFPGLVVGGDLTITVSNIRFAEPVTVDESTFLFHTFYDAEQVDQLGAGAYEHLHNHHTATDPFRDEHHFASANVFDHGHHGAANTVLADVRPVIIGNGTDTIGFTLTVPYDLLKSLEQTTQPVPPGLPGPQGFLEPYHFHIEYVVAPEPASWLSLAVAALTLRLARRARRTSSRV